MKVSYTLLTDGSSDRILQQPIQWLLRQWGIDFQAQWATGYPGSTCDKIARSLQEYPCDVLIVHRDAEREPWLKRRQEILKAFADQQQALVCLVPVRMSEAWFLFDEVAIRRAANNPNGRVALRLPPMSQIESLEDPKEALYQLLRQASEFSGRRLKKFSPQEATQRMADLLEDFSALQGLPAFQQFEAELRQAVEAIGSRSPQAS